ncbi:hypothetical protein LTR85_010493 [Meristemomyces frigidus]|nr:hypothetical protein LTR85_010493 [Meristemomyces frigidus]
MAHTNVSSCVLSIVASFSSGLDVFKKLRERRRRKRRSKSGEKGDEDELCLTKSLRQGPEDIGREYQRSVQAAGDYFAVGDAIAQTSLAEILLKLNTGLVSIISSFLSRDKKDVQLDYQSLTTLSEQSRIDTCRTLRQLFRRMDQLYRAPAPRVRAALPSSEEATADAVYTGEKKRRRKPVVKQHTKIRGPTLARVVIQDSSKPSTIAMVKPGERRKKSSSSNASSRADPAVHLPVSAPASSPPPYEVIEKPEKPARPVAPRSSTMPETSRPRRKHSAANFKPPSVPVKPEALRATQSTPRLRITKDQHQDYLPVPSTTPLPAVEPRRRKQPAETYYSIASASTKLGEIPLHKWAQPFDFDAMSLMNKEAEKDGWPVNELPGGGEGKKKRFGIFRLFRKKEALA